MDGGPPNKFIFQDNSLLDFKLEVIPNGAAANGTLLHEASVIYPPSGAININARHHYMTQLGFSNPYLSWLAMAITKRILSQFTLAGDISSTLHVFDADAKLWNQEQTTPKPGCYGRLHLELAYSLNWGAP